MKWENKQGKIIETDDIMDTEYLHNLINFLIKKLEENNENEIEDTGIGNYDGGFFYKN